MNILIIKHGSIGDFVISIGAMKSIRHKFPKKKIYLLTTTLMKNIFYKIPFIDENTPMSKALRIMTQKKF